MKHKIGALIALSLALATPFALATKPGNNGGGNGGCGQGQTTNGCGGSTTGPATGIGLGIAGAAAGAQAGANSSSTSDAQAASRSVSGATANNSASTNSSGQASNSMGDLSVSGDSGHTFVAPAPAVTYVPQSNGGIITKSHSVGIGWNLLSWSKSEQMTDPFQGTMRLIAQYESLCQFETAAMLRQRQYALLDPAYRELPAQPGVVNLTPEQCAARR
jgi:hypothetical protein